MTRGPRLLKTALWTSLFVLACSFNTRADTVVTFTIGSPGGNFGPSYVEQGFSFTSSNVNIFNNQLEVTSLNEPFPIVITFAGGAFDFISLDYVFAGGFSGTIFTASNGATFIPQFDGVSYTLGPEFQNITSLTLTHFAVAPGPTFNVYDNFRFQPVSTSTAPVPEPTTIGLLGLGLAGIRALKRRRRKTNI